MKIPIIVDTSPARDVRLLAHAAKKHFPSVEEVHVTPTVRLGHSGARVYRARAKTAGNHWSRYFYSKVGARSKLQDEFDAYLKYVENEIPTFTPAWFVDGTKEACLCCFVAGRNPHDEPSPLVDLLSHPTGAPLSKVCGAISRMYNMLANSWRKDSRLTEIHWIADYADYLRWSRTQSFAKSWLGQNECRQRTIKIYGRELVSPLRMINQIGTENWKERVYTRPVHGDLHQRNIIMDKVGGELDPWLVDFGWTCEFHSMVDYALLEASLKSFHFGHFFGEEHYLELHDLLHEGGKGNMRHRGAEEAMLRLVRTIRRKARKEVCDKKAWPREYYLASLIVNIGLLSIPTNLVRTTWLTSAWFASHIES
jgi:hypothetical protein